MDQIREQDSKTDPVHNCTDLHGPTHNSHITKPWNISNPSAPVIKPQAPQPVNRPESMDQIGEHGTKSEPVLNSDRLHSAFNRGAFLASPHQSRLKA